MYLILLETPALLRCHPCFILSHILQSKVSYFALTRESIAFLRREVYSDYFTNFVEATFYG